jgi:hypothetical protein
LSNTDTTFTLGLKHEKLRRLARATELLMYVSEKLMAAVTLPQKKAKNLLWICSAKLP